MLRGREWAGDTPGANAAEEFLTILFPELYRQSGWEYQQRLTSRAGLRQSAYWLLQPVLGSPIGD